MEIPKITENADTLPKCLHHCTITFKKWRF